MRRVILTQGETFSNDHLQRTSAFNAGALEAATNIVARVREEGDAALRDLTAKFDGVEIEDFRVSQEAIDAAIAQIDPHLRKSLAQAARQIRAFHERQKQQSWFSVRPTGPWWAARSSPSNRWASTPRAAAPLYPSTVLAGNAIPAHVAGVSRIALCTPPTKDGSLDPAVLEAARLAGITEISTFAGGAQAIAALAYGTESIAPVSKITGPAISRAAAKKIVSGDVGIDMIAGPSEVCVVADETADPKMVAIDLMAQAEHDPLASCYLVTFSTAYADEVEANIADHMKRSKRAEITAASLEHGLIVVVPDMATAIEAVNVIAPRARSSMIAEPHIRWRVRNAGAIFLGEWTPEAVGDYVAGPTTPCRPAVARLRFSEPPLSVDDFTRQFSTRPLRPRRRGHRGDCRSRGPVEPRRKRAPAPGRAARQREDPGTGR